MKKKHWIGLGVLVGFLFLSHGIDHIQKRIKKRKQAQE